MNFREHALAIRLKLRAGMVFFSNRGDEVSMCDFKETDFFSFLGGIGGPKMVLKAVPKLIQN